MPCTAIKPFGWSILLTAFFVGCTNPEKTKETTPPASLYPMTKCFITKPVVDDAKYTAPVKLKQVTARIDQYLHAVAESNRRDIDSNLLYITSFEYQKEIYINYKCYGKLHEPDSAGLMDLYFQSGSITKTMTRSIVQYQRSYQKDIYGFGKATVYEYSFGDVAEVEPDFMYILIKEPTEDALRYGEDYQGIVLCSDELNWRKFKEKETPSFIQTVKGDLKFEVPLLYDGNRFVPLVHFDIKPGSAAAE